MSSTRMEIDLGRIQENARRLRDLYGARGVKITAVTKGVCGALPVAEALLRGGIHSLGEARLINIERMRNAGIQAQFMLLRPPRPSDADRVVQLADVSLNTEISVIRLLADHARRRDKTHQVILMVELGDLREGIMPSRLDAVIEEMLGLRGVTLVGIGTNLACLNGIQPTAAKMSELSELAARIESKYDIHLEIVSGGNSANHQWLLSSDNVGRINHLRIGEAILLGCETLQRHPIAGLATDAFTLVGEVIEVKTKPSCPFGKGGQDAFGREPIFKDFGNIRRAIVALGEQDVDPCALRPRGDAEVLGASSDQLVLYDKDASLRIGEEMRFDIGYGALLRAMTSPYIEKMYLPASPGGH